MEFDDHSKLFSIQNGGNTCYIDSLLMALFYTPSIIEQMLHRDPKTALAMYLQEYIKCNFIEPVRLHRSINGEDMNLLRRICIENEWLSQLIKINSTEFSEEEFSQQDVSEFYSFLSSLFNNENIKIKKKIISDVYEDIEDNNEESINYIPISIPDNIEKISVKQMLDNWLHHNYVTLNKNNTDIRCLIQYRIINSPDLLVLSINRFKHPNIRDNTNVIIQNRLKKITPNFSNTDDDYVFHAAVCHRGTSVNSGHYYSILNFNESFFIFDDLSLPSFYQVSMQDKTVTNEIKKDCVLLIYRKN